MGTPARFCHLTVDEITKSAYVWHEENWQFSDDFHSHKMGQIIYVEKGFQYLYAGKNRYLLPLHYCAYVPPGLVHKSVSPLDNVFLRTLYFSIETEEEFYHQLHIFHTPKILREMILYSERYSRLIDYDSVEAIFLKAILALLPDCSADRQNLILPVPQDNRLLSVVENASADLSETRDVYEMIMQQGMSQRTFQRLFKKETGMSFSTYSRLLKMIKAVELLSVSDENISEIAYKVGYTSLATFSTTFKQTIGVSPQQIKKMLNN